MRLFSDKWVIFKQLRVNTMNLNFRKTVALLSLVLPLISHASQSCGAGVIIGLADHYQGQQKTAIYLRPTVPDTPPVQYFFRCRSGVDTQGSDRRFGTITRDLRRAFFDKTQVRIYSSTGSCDNIDEVVLGTERSSGMPFPIWVSIDD